MKRIIRLTESDIQNMVLEAILESNAEINEGKWGRRLGTAALAALMAGGTMHALKQANDADDLTWDDIRLDTPRFEREAPTPDPDIIDINGDGYLTRDEYVAGEYLNNVKKKYGKTETDRLSKDNVKHNERDKRDFVASSDLIDYIKNYETFHNGWINDGAGYLTTGWGFKQTPELKKKWPNGLHQKMDSNGNLSCPEADAYLLHYIENTTDDFISRTPNIKMLPQHVKDALYDLYYNIGPTKYSEAEQLQQALKKYPKTKNIQDIVNHMRYAKSKGKVMKGLQRRSTDRQDLALYGDYNREDFTTLKDLKKARKNSVKKTKASKK